MQWSVQDALTVLDEIDNRLSVIAAIEKLAGDPDADELHTLHPLVTQARWLFGPEYDSPEYSFNRTLMTIAVELFGATPEQIDFYKPARRPDLVALANSTMGLVATDSFDASDSSLVELQSVLLIELKRGRSTIGRTEVNQAGGYVEDFLSSGIDGTPFFNAFVVGHKRDPKVPVVREIKPDGSVLRGRVCATMYDQLTRTANKRLLGLKARIPSRYEDVSGYDLVRRVMDTPSQAYLQLDTPESAPTKPDKA